MAKLSKATQLRTFVMASGERYCTLVDRRTGIPLFNPNLFVTTQIRNNSDSLSAMEAALNGIQILIAFCEDRGLDLEGRIRNREFLKPCELDEIRDMCQKCFAPSSTDANPKILKFEPPKTRVAKATEYVRLTEIADYLNWLSRFLLGSALDRNTAMQVHHMVEGLKARRPSFRHRNQIRREYGFDDEQIDKLFAVIKPFASENPFADPGVQVRNYAMINTLVYVGNRGGELLSLRVPDVNFRNNQILIARRADEIADPRLYQPLVKTLDRLVPMRDSLASLLYDYIFNYRDKVPNADQNDFLFVTHKSGETHGQPLSISGYQKMIKTIANAASELAGLHGHALRHTWNRRFSEFMDTLENPKSPEEQESLRSYLMGWLEGSGTAAAYNRRHTEWKAMKAGLEMQEGFIRVPGNLHYGD